MPNLYTPARQETYLSFAPPTSFRLAGEPINFVSLSRLNQKCQWQNSKWGSLFLSPLQDVHELSRQIGHFEIKDHCFCPFSLGLNANLFIWDNLPALPRVFSLRLGWKLERGLRAGAVSLRPWVRSQCPGGGLRVQPPSGSINQNLVYENVASQQVE